MLCHKSGGLGTKPTPLPAHPEQDLYPVRDANLRVGKGLAESFNYVFPVSKYCPANFQPGPVYRGGEAAAIGNQPYLFDQSNVGKHTPSIMDWKTLPVFKGTQSAASFAIAQQTMYQMIALRSINAGR